MITATGKYSGEKMKVQYENGKCTFNGKKDNILKMILDIELRERHSIAGTFYPEVDSNLNVYNVLQYYFFDDEPVIEVKDEEIEEMPCEEGVVY